MALLIYKLPDNHEFIVKGDATVNSITVVCPSPEFLSTLDSNLTDEEKMIHLANKDLDTGTKYEIIDAEELPPDWEFRGAWEYVAGSEEKTSLDLSVDDQLKYNKITQEEYDASNG
jgi:hypothetical protein